MTKKRCYQSVLGVILLAGSALVSGAHAQIGLNEREQKKKVELMVVEKQREKPARNNNSRGQRPSDRRR